MTTAERIAEYLKTADLSRTRECDIARHLCSSRAVIQRKLQSEGETYRSLRTAERQRRCLELLAINPRPDLALIARKCGYIQPNTAGRAFRQWFGYTLRELKGSV